MTTIWRISTTLSLFYFLKCFLEQWGAGLMIASWATVEVPRYAFYLMALVTGDATKKTPYPLFWMRYSLFAVLYPTGITGELTVFLSAASDADFVEQAFVGAALFYGTLLPIVYFFGSPLMIFNMVSNRSSAMKKRFAKPPPKPIGLCWPVDDKGERSSTKINQAILAAAVGAVNDDKAKAIMKNKKWRFDYWKHLKALVEEQCTSPENALKIAQAGMDKAYELFEFVAPDGSAMSFKEAMAQPKDVKNAFHTMEIKGNSSTAKIEQVQVPYKGEILAGDKLKKQVQAWVDDGTIEPSAGQAIIQCIDGGSFLSRDIFWCHVSKIEKNGDRHYLVSHFDFRSPSESPPRLIILPQQPTERTTTKTTTIKQQHNKRHELSNKSTTTTTTRQNYKNSPPTTTKHEQPNNNKKSPS